MLLDDALREDIPLACDFLGVADPDRPLPAMDAAVRERRLHDFVRRLIEARSAQSPALLLFDDLHWIDAESESFIAQLISVVGHTRTFVLGNQRPEYDPPWKSRPDYQQISLSPLGHAEALELAGEILGGDPSLVDLRKRLVERTEGNPFFTEEMVRGLAESGELEGESGAYRAAHPIDVLELPATVQAILAARIDRLDEEEKRLLQAAAVVGLQVSEPILLAIAGLTGDDLSAALSQLGDVGLLIQQSLYPVAEYAFRHPLTHEVAYGSQLSARRAETHARVARALVDLHASSIEEHASLVAHHWDSANDPEQAIGWHRRAALVHAGRNATTSLAHWTRVRERLGEISQSEETLRARIEACTQILYRTWNIGLDDDSDWQPAYQEGIALAEQLGDDAVRASLLSGVAGLRGFRGEHLVQVELLEEALELARRRGDFAVEASLHQRIGWSWGLAGENDRAIEWSRRGIEFCERDLPSSGAAGGFGTYAYLLAQLGMALADDGRLEEASSILDRAQAVSRFTGDPFSLVNHHAALNRINFIRDDREAHIAAQRRITASLLEQAPSGLSRGYLLVLQALLLFEFEDWAGSLEALEASAAETGRIVSMRLGFRIVGVLALAKLGDQEGARAVLDEIGELYERTPALKLDNPMAQLRWSEAHRILYGASAREEIEACCARVIDAAYKRGFATLEPSALVERAQLAKLLGDEAARQRDLSEAAALFRKIGAPRRAEALERIQAPQP